MCLPAPAHPLARSRAPLVPRRPCPRDPRLSPALPHIAGAVRLVPVRLAHPGPPAREPSVPRRAASAACYRPGASAVEARTTSSGWKTNSVRWTGFPPTSSSSDCTAAWAIARTGCRIVVSGGSVNAISSESS